MWQIFEPITAQVQLYSGFWGKMWIILTFLCRLIIGAVIATSSYADEQSAFECDTTIVGCTRMCYDNFAKVSHPSFWLMQILAEIVPILIFFLIQENLTNKVEKTKRNENARRYVDSVNNTENNDNSTEYSMESVMNSLQSHRKVGKYKVKNVTKDGLTREVVDTNFTRLAYFLHLILKIAIQIGFTLWGKSIFNIEKIDNDNVLKSSGFLNYLWMLVPGFYPCREDGWKEGKTSDLTTACFQHLAIHRNNKISTNHVACWVSRPTEKTVFLRAMNVLGFLCLILTVLELFHFIIKIWFKKDEPHQFVLDYLMNQYNQLKNSISPQQADDNHVTNQAGSGAYQAPNNFQASQMQDTQFQTTQFQVPQLQAAQVQRPQIVNNQHYNDANHYYNAAPSTSQYTGSVHQRSVTNPPTMQVYDPPMRNYSKPKKYGVKNAHL